MLFVEWRRGEEIDMGVVRPFHVPLFHNASLTGGGRRAPSRVHPACAGAPAPPGPRKSYSIATPPAKQQSATIVAMTGLLKYNGVHL
jgi:hypothetical protein